MLTSPRVVRRRARPHVWGVFVGCVVVLAATSVIGGWRATPSPSAVSHLLFLWAGILHMVLIGVWANTDRRMRATAGVFALAGAAALTVGVLGASPPTAKLFAPDALTRSLPQVKLALPGLDETGYVNRNALGAAALMVFPVAAGLLLGLRRPRGRDWPAAAGALAALLSAYVIFASQSRSTWVAAWVIGLLVCLRVGTSWRLRALLLACVMLTTTAAVVWVQQSAAVDLRSLASVARESAGARDEILDQGVAALRTSPWFGVGLNEFRYIHVASEDTAFTQTAHAHNVLLQTALDVGVFGLLAYLGLTGILIVWSDRIARGLAPETAGIIGGAGLALVGVQVFGVLDVVALGAKVGMFQWWASGLILAAMLRRRAGSGGVAADL